MHGKFNMSAAEYPFVMFKSLIIFVIIHSDFLPCNSLSPALKCIEACFWPSHLHEFMDLTRCVINSTEKSEKKVSTLKQKFKICLILPDLCPLSYFVLVC